MKLSVVIPAYNESQNIIATISELVAAVRAPVDSLEVIVVDDHSGDNTFDLAKSVHDMPVRCLRLSRRCGSHAALRIGLSESSGDAVLCISADGQDDPAVIDTMLARWRDGDQIVWALRENRDDEPLRVRLLAHAFYRLLNFFNKTENPSLDLSRADFYLLDRRVVNALVSCGERVTSLFGLIAWVGFRQSSVEYHRRPRRSGGSKWNFRQRTALAVDWIVSFSWLPLRISVLMGFFIAILGAIYAVIIVVNAILGEPVEGWSSVMTVVLLLAGIQLVVLGVIGEYVGRGFDEARKRPIAFIESDSLSDG